MKKKGIVMRKKRTLRNQKKQQKKQRRKTMKTGGKDEVTENVANDPFMPITKEVNTVTFLTHPSSLYDDKSIKSQVLVDKTFPSFYENVKYQMDSVDEMLGYLKKNKKPKVHREYFVLERPYKT